MKFYTKFHILQKKGSSVAKIKLESIIKRAKRFLSSLIQQKHDDVVLAEKTKETLDALLKQVDKTVINRLKLGDKR